MSVAIFGQQPTNAALVEPERNGQCVSVACRRHMCVCTNGWVGGLQGGGEVISQHSARVAACQFSKLIWTEGWEADGLERQRVLRKDKCGTHYSVHFQSRYVLMQQGPRAS